LDNDVAKLLVFSPDVLSSLGCCMNHIQTSEELTACADSANYFS
jgi:hypothetical protein